MNKIFRLTIKFGIGFLLTACALSAQPVSPLAGTSWHLTALGPEWPVDPADGLSLIFDQHGFVRGSTGCNEFSGSYIANSAEIEFGPLEVTERACQEQFKMDQEKNYLEALRLAKKYSIYDGDARMIMSAANGSKPLEFSK